MTRRLVETGVTIMAWLCGALLTTSVAGLLGYVIVNGAGSLSASLFFGDTAPMDALLLRRQVFDGIFPAMVGTLVLVGLSIIIAVPVGVGAGIYMAEFAGRRIKGIFGLFFDILAGIPSVLVGLFGFSLAVFLHHRLSDRITPCLLISALSLAFLVLPYLIRTTQTALEALPRQIRITAPALGASRLQTLFYVLLPQSLSGIVSGIILSIGRCAEDTAVIMLTGVVATAGIPTSLLANYEALPFFIYTISAQYADQAELMRGYGAAIVLLAICAALFTLAAAIRHRLADHLLYGTR
ncbi:PstA family ABC transporter permease [Desulfosarcina ovata]|uniref:Phosphate ABC transporter permease n=1 Tax=Desulfosarcina ovata subsp. ovata TaxID=2752305 RepID=A0A5K8ADN8_9BACT|nr:ABC transporter permease subunit [Desulfosarcina ovata]BBO90656.1 phosphate ABC transporter permease [Desulfosarcina ovata subsp. ovata]